MTSISRIPSFLADLFNDRDRHRLLTTQTAHVLAPNLHDSPSKPEDAVDRTASASDVLETTLRVTKEVGEILNEIPYVKGITGVLLQFIRIRDELKTNKERCQELVDKIMSRSRVILEGLLDIAKAGSIPLLQDIEDLLVRYQNFLRDMFQEVKLLSTKKMPSRILNRQSHSEVLLRIDRRMDDFDRDFNTRLNIKSFVQRSDSFSPRSPAEETIISKPFPPEPHLLVGRDEEKRTLLSCLLLSCARVAILGGGGMGKTTLAISALHNADVVQLYKLPHFISCEVVDSFTALLNVFADILHIPLSDRSPNLLYEAVLASLRGSQRKHLILLDNFESVWEDESIRAETEEFLSHLDRIPNVSIVITMRGTQRPNGLSWSTPLLPALSALSWESSKSIFESLSQSPIDEYAEKLLVEADGVPLAITLLAAMLRDGDETSQSLWRRWTTEAVPTSLIDNGGPGRLSNLNKSIQLSLNSPRLNSDRNTLSVLALLSQLPGGLAPSDEVMDGLQSFCPLDISLRKSIVTLRRVSLVHIESHPTKRIRMLSPVRQFCRSTLEVPNQLRRALTAFHVHLLTTHTDKTSKIDHAAISPELINMHSMLTLAYEAGEVVEPDIIEASISFTSWSIYTGNQISDLIHRAIDATRNRPELLGRCLQAKGELDYFYNRLDDAEESLISGLALHRQLHDLNGEANAFLTLGDVYLRRHRLDKAEESLKSALNRHEQEQDTRGQADDFWRLGKLFMLQYKLDNAQSVLEKALALHLEVGDVLGQANDYRRLSKLYMRKHRLDEGKELLMKALALHKEANDIVGQANDLRRQSKLCMRLGQLDEAEGWAREAVDLHHLAQDTFERANDLRRLGDIYRQRGKLEQADETLKLALRLHEQIQHSLGQANDLHALGEVALQRDDLDGALTFLTSALEIHQAVSHVVGSAHDLQCLGDLYLRKGQLADAEECLAKALDRHQQVGHAIGEAADRFHLGKLFAQRGLLQNAAEMLDGAFKLYAQVHSVPGQADVLRCQGEVYLARSQKDLATSSFRSAVSLYEQLDDHVALASVQLLLQKSCIVSSE